MSTAIGTTVIYVLSDADVERINGRRVSDYDVSRREYYWPQGAQGHLGTPVTTGDHVPLIVVRIDPDSSVHGQALLDGEDSLWVRSAPPGTTPGTWHTAESESPLSISS